jgi:hypothetical protein
VGRPTRDRRLNTYGARLFRAPQAGRIDYDVEGLRQTGRVSTTTAATAPSQAVSAGFVHAEAGYLWRAAWKPHLALEYDWASGDRAGGSYGRFDTLFGMRGGDYAPSGLFAALHRANSHMLGARLEASPSARLDVMLHYAPVWLASRTDAFSTTNVRDATGGSGRFAGHLLHGRARVWLVPRSLRLDIDAVLLAKGRFLRTAPNAPRTGDTHYLAMALNALF